jgi:hypothetical protein
MRYHLETLEGSRLINISAYPNEEAAWRGRQSDKKWEDDVNQTLQERWEERIKASLFDTDCNDSIPELEPYQIKRQWQITTCDSSECVACWEAGLIPAWPGLVY